LSWCSGKTIEVTYRGKTVNVRDYGRGIPLGKVIDVVSKMNTGGKYDSLAFKKSVGLNGVGTKALLCNFPVWNQFVMRNKPRIFSAGNLMLEEEVIDTTKRKGTKVTFIRMKLFLKITNTAMST
jgi:topoisomerase-4 subunit B